MNMIHAKLRHIIESNSSEEGVSSCSSVAGDEIHDYGVPGSFSWFRSEEATSLMRCIVLAVRACWFLRRFLSSDRICCCAHTSMLRVHYFSSGGRCSGIRHGSAWVCPSPR